MNIRDVGMWPNQEPIPTAGYEMAVEMINLRLRTHLGFISREERKGFIRQGTSLSSSQGQEMIRLYLARATEEVVEATEAISRDHVLEELIDSVNFLMCPPLLCYTTNSLEEYAKTLGSFLINSFCLGISHVTREWVGHYVCRVYGIGDHLRNRSWMEQTQSLSFEHYGLLLYLISQGVGMILSYFDNIGEFWMYYKAKDNVLQFRLRSGY